MLDSKEEKRKQRREVLSCLPQQTPWTNCMWYAYNISARWWRLVGWLQVKFFFDIKRILIIYTHIIQYVRVYTNVIISFCPSSSHFSMYYTRAHTHSLRHHLSSHGLSSFPFCFFCSSASSTRYFVVIHSALYPPCRGSIQSREGIFVCSLLAVMSIIIIILMTAQVESTFASAEKKWSPF